VTLSEARARIGSRVVYRRADGPHTVEEHGVIADVSAVFVMVHFDGDRHAKATAPGLLDWAGERR